MLLRTKCVKRTNGFVAFSANLRSHKALQRVTSASVVRVAVEQKESYFGWDGMFDEDSADSILISDLLAANNGIVDGTPVSVSFESFYHVSKRIVMEVAQQTDYELLSGRSSPLETDFLNQVRVVYLNESLPIYVNSATVAVAKVKLIADGGEAPFAWIDDNAEIEFQLTEQATPAGTEMQPHALQFSLTQSFAEPNNHFATINLKLSTFDREKCDSLFTVTLDGKPLCPVLANKDSVFSKRSFLHCRALAEMRLKLRPNSVICKESSLTIREAKEADFKFSEIKDLRIQVASDFKDLAAVKDRLSAELKSFPFDDETLILPLNRVFSCNHHFAYKLVSKDESCVHFLKIDHSETSEIDAFAQFLNNDANYSLLTNDSAFETPLFWNCIAQPLKSTFDMYQALETNRFGDKFVVSVRGPARSGKSTVSAVFSSILNCNSLTINLRKLMFDSSTEWKAFEAKMTEQVLSCMDQERLALILDGTDEMIALEETDDSKRQKDKVFAYFQRYLQQTFRQTRSFLHQTCRRFAVGKQRFCP